STRLDRRSSPATFPLIYQMLRVFCCLSRWVRRGGGTSNFTLASRRSSRDAMPRPQIKCSSGTCASRNSIVNQLPLTEYLRLQMSKAKISHRGQLVEPYQRLFSIQKRSHHKHGLGHQLIGWMSANT